MTRPEIEALEDQLCARSDGWARRVSAALRWLLDENARLEGAMSNMDSAYEVEYRASIVELEQQNAADLAAHAAELERVRVRFGARIAELERTGDDLRAAIGLYSQRIGEDEDKLAELERIVLAALEEIERWAPGSGQAQMAEVMRQIAKIRAALVGD